MSDFYWHIVYTFDGVHEMDEDMDYEETAECLCDSLRRQGATIISVEKIPDIL